MFDPTGRLHHKSRRNALKDRADISLDGLFLRIDRIAAGRQRGVEAGQTEGRGERYRASRRANRHVGRRSLRLELASMRNIDATPDGRRERSEEHTSELQSLMRISYAVFCLKKNT